MQDVSLEFAKLVGEPINYQLPVPVALAEICNIHVVEGNEKTWRPTTMDTIEDTILDVDTSNGRLTIIKRSPVSDTQLTFKQLNSQLEYVLLADLIGSPDANILARKKAAISRGMDKTEVRLIMSAIITDPGVAAGGAPTGTSIVTITPASGEDLLEVILRAKRAVEDYGDSFVCLCGTNVKAAIEDYDVNNVATNNYNLTAEERLAKKGIKLVKMFGIVKNTGDSTADVLLDADKFIMVAVNSTLPEGEKKPIAFVRRKLDPAMAVAMGLNVEAAAQRAYLAVPAPVIDGSSYNMLAYAIAGYESVIFAILNPKAIVKSASCSALY